MSGGSVPWTTRVKSLETEATSPEITQVAEAKREDNPETDEAKGPVPKVHVRTDDGC